MLAGYEHLIGGIFGGVASTITCHPFDLLKIRYSANEGSLIRPQYTSYVDAVKSIVRANGVRGLYQGLSPAIIGAPLSWGCYFHLYHIVRSGIGTFSLPFLDNLLAGCATGVMVLGVTNPLWVCKTRLCLQYENMGAREYQSLRDCFRKIYHREGIRGFYRGFIFVGLMGTINGAVQFAIYNRMKDLRCTYLDLPSDSQLSTLDYLFFSMMSRVSSTMLMFPYQVLRTRLQDRHGSYKGVIDCALKTLSNEGAKGMYKGMHMAILKQLPNSVVTYVVYEKVRYLLEHSNK